MDRATEGQPRKLDDWGVLKAWAWGAEEALNYFEMDKAVDAKQVGLAGHSRFGKAVLVAMAYESASLPSATSVRRARAARSCTGTFMVSRFRTLPSSSLYHWFDGNFLRYAGPLNAGDLPVDNHELIALCAPRPLFIGGGADAGDGYANPKRRCVG